MKNYNVYEKSAVQIHGGIFKMSTMKEKHTFVICAYKESAYLEECVKSLKEQKKESNIIMVTSTPNDYIKNICEKYDVELKINHGQGGIVQDWNFGYNQARTPYVTIAHQDDLYFSDYSIRAVRKLVESKHPLIYFSDYCEIRNGEKVRNNRLLKTKRMLLSPLKIKRCQKSRFLRRRILSLGNGICCPSVTFAKENLPNPVFRVHFRSNEDWEAWERLSRLKGDFLYDSTIQMGHRIHEESETSVIIGDNARSKEDYEMFCKFWPKCIAKFLSNFYAKSEKSNKIN